MFEYKGKDSYASFSAMITPSGGINYDELNGAEYDHKVIAVSIARPRTERQSNGGYRDRNSNSRRY